MKVGDYVRTKTKGIFKLDDSLYYNEDFKEYWFKAPTDVGDYKTTERSVIKSSSNIIDLIEVGDYVNGEKVCAIGENSGDVYIRDLQEFILANEIKSIVTKENFESMEYRIGE